MKIKVGLVGCGNIGTALSNAIKEKFNDVAEVIAVYDIDKEKAKKLGPLMPIDELIEKSDLVIEAVSPEVSQKLVIDVINKGKKILVLSTGGLLNIKMQKGIYFPSGAIAGLDGISAAALSHIEKINLVTTKPQRSLNHEGLKRNKVVFNGSVYDAIKKYPKNINVCATLAIASGKPELINVKIIASPKITKNIHKIEVEGSFGKMKFIMENEPSPGNPKTSYLAVLSAIDTLRKILYG